MAKHMDKQTSRRGVPIRKLNYLMAGITLVVSVVLLIVSYRTFALYGVMQQKTNTSIDGQKSARDMQEASDYLTEQVRCFVETGERTYLDAYFEECDGTQRREKALTQLAKTSADTEEYAALRHAMEQSLALMQTEFCAMRLSAEARGYDLADYPDEVREAWLSPAQTAMTAEQKAAAARELVFDDAYHDAKDEIARQTDACLQQLIGNMQNDATETTRSFGVMIRVEQGLIIALIAIVLIIVALTTVQVIGPLVRAIPRIRDDKPIPVRGALEFRYLANTYNRIYEENRSQKEELEYEASHDQLTGVYNRKGFEQILKQADCADMTLLLIDIDRFKKDQRYLRPRGGRPGAGAGDEHSRRQLPHGRCAVPHRRRRVRAVFAKRRTHQSRRYQGKDRPHQRRTAKGRPRHASHFHQRGRGVRRERTGVADL